MYQYFNVYIVSCHSNRLLKGYQNRRVYPLPDETHDYLRDKDLIKFVSDLLDWSNILNNVL